MRVLIGCETSGRVRDAFIARGFDAWSCDLLPSKVAGPHYQCDVFEAIRNYGPWDAGIFFPTCTYVCGSGIHWTKRGLRDPQLTVDAVQFVKDLWDCGIEQVGIENPVGVLSTEFMEPTQIIQPWMFGEDASKATCLWLRKLPELRPTKYIPPSFGHPQRKVGYALGKPDRQRPKPSAAKRRPLGLAQHHLPGRGRCNGRTMGACTRAGA